MNRRCSCCREAGHNISNCPEIVSYFDRINNFSSAQEAFNIMNHFPKNILKRYVMLFVPRESSTGYETASKDELITLIINFKFQGEHIIEDNELIDLTDDEVINQDINQEYILRLLSILRQMEVQPIEVVGRYITNPEYDGIVSDVPIAEATRIDSVKEDIPIAYCVQIL
jgi:hypothetical protein